jgi:hypothetical protein
MSNKPRRSSTANKVQEPHQLNTIIKLRGGGYYAYSTKVSFAVGFVSSELIFEEVKFPSPLNLPLRLSYRFESIRASASITQ